MEVLISGEIINPLVSIITPLYNSGKFISETIESVLSQSFRDWELIIVDDCSTDNSVDIIRGYAAKDNRINIILLSENSGVSAARNVAIKSARGRYIAFLDSDDVWLPKKLEVQLEFMLKHDVVFCFSAYDKINEKGEIIGHLGVPERVTYSELLKTCVIGCLTAIYDAGVLGKLYMPTGSRKEDFGLWLLLLKKIKYAYGIDETLALYRMHSGSITANKLRTALDMWRHYRDIEKLPFFISVYCFLHYAVRGIIRYKFS